MSERLYSNDSVTCRLLPLNSFVSAEGVEVFPNITPTQVEADGSKVKVTTSSGIEVGRRSCDSHVTECSGHMTPCS